MENLNLKNLEKKYNELSENLNENYYELLNIYKNLVVIYYKERAKNEI
jgi:hypothetical protein